ncbi:hypothetical protein [Klebsiella pneumoniae]|nr:hypothetical protein [Klebsiella pneumoniae]
MDSAKDSGREMLAAINVEGSGFGDAANLLI